MMDGLIYMDQFIYLFIAPYWIFKEINKLKKYIYISIQINVHIAIVLSSI